MRLIKRSQVLGGSKRSSLSHNTQTEMHKHTNSQLLAHTVSITLVHITLTYINFLESDTNLKSVFRPKSTDLLAEWLGFVPKKAGKWLRERSVETDLCPHNTSKCKYQHARLAVMQTGKLCEIWIIITISWFRAMAEMMEELRVWVLD